MSGRSEDHPRVGHRDASHLPHERVDSFPVLVQTRFARVFYASHRSRAISAAGLIALTIVLAWLVTYASGGTRGVAAHAFYVPILLASTRFRWRAAVLTAVVSGIAVGPLSYLDVVGSVPQSTTAWASRLAVFVAFALFVSWLTSESRTAIIAKVLDARGARELRTALDRHEFEVFYQPIFELSTERVVGTEALLRWRHPDYGLLPPCDFIPLAERTGVIIPMEVFVLGEATRQTAQWRESGLGGADLTIAVNLSAPHLDDPHLVEHVHDALRDSGLPPEQLCLEITETAIIQDFSSALQGVMDLRALGVRIALDDFGTGLSSLAYLQNLPIDIIKVDRMFVAEVDTNRRSAAVVSGILMLAGAMNAVTIAEGIETRSQLDTLRALGCTKGQGFLVSRPVPADELAARIPSMPA